MEGLQPLPLPRLVSSWPATACWPSTHPASARGPLAALAALDAHEAASSWEAAPCTAVGVEGADGQQFVQVGRPTSMRGWDSGVPQLRHGTTRPWSSAPGVGSANQPPTPRGPDGASTLPVPERSDDPYSRSVGGSHGSPSWCSG